jgi:hypothetical protein
MNLLIYGSKELNCKIWDKRNRLSESRITATNGLLGSTNYPSTQETDSVCLSFMDDKR